jgi:hypothetical protein
MPRSDGRPPRSDGSHPNSRKNLKVGNPGNKGGPGAPSSELRKRCREAFSVGIDYATELLQNSERGSDTDKLRALDIAGKYGLGEATTLVRKELVEAVAAVIGDSELVPDEAKPALLEQIFDRLNETG